MTTMSYRIIEHNVNDFSIQEKRWWGWKTVDGYSASLEEAQKKLDWLAIRLERLFNPKVVDERTINI